MISQQVRARGRAPCKTVGSPIIPRMDRLRHAHLLACAVLAWFVFTMAAGVAAPVFKQAELEAVCTGGGGLVLVDHGGTPVKTTGGHSLDCPLCASVSAPPSASPTFHLPPFAHAIDATVQVLPRLVSTAAPQWPRGPPRFS
jgi:hypothetical protein